MQSIVSEWNDGAVTKAVVLYKEAEEKKIPHCESVRDQQSL